MVPSTRPSLISYLPLDKRLRGSARAGSAAQVQKRASPDLWERKVRQLQPSGMITRTRLSHAEH